MVLIYSEKRLKGLSGRYIAPYFFDEKQLRNVEKVYTTDEKLFKELKAKKVNVEFVKGAK